MELEPLVETAAAAYAVTHLVVAGIGAHYRQSNLLYHNKPYVNEFLKRARETVLDPSTFVISGLLTFAELPFLLHYGIKF